MWDKRNRKSRNLFIFVVIKVKAKIMEPQLLHVILINVRNICLFEEKTRSLY